LQRRPVILRSLLIVATPYQSRCALMSTNCNTLQHTQSASTNCNTLQHTQSASTHCNTLQYTQSASTNFNTLQHTQSLSTNRKTLQHSRLCACQQIATHCIIVGLGSRCFDGQVLCLPLFSFFTPLLPPLHANSRFTHLFNQSRRSFVYAGAHAHMHTHMHMHPHTHDPKY